MPSFALSFLSLGPNVTREGDRLIAETSMLVRVLSLFSWNKEMEACPREGKVVIRRTALWLLKKTTEVPFTQVREINYKYSNLVPFSGFTAADAVDCYTVLLELHDRSEIKLFQWVGQGEFENNSLWPDWCYWDEYIVDLTGTQQNESMAFFELLRNMWKGAVQSAFTGPAAPPVAGVEQHAPRAKPSARPAPPPPG